MGHIKPEVLLDYLKQDLSSVSGDINTFKADALLASIFKKYVPEANRASLDAEAKENFLSLNGSISNTSLLPLADESSVIRSWRWILNRSINCDEGSNYVTFQRCWGYGHTGPGSTIGTKSTDFCGKMFDSDLTFTRRFLVEHYRSNLVGRWAEAELIRSSTFTFHEVKGSKLSTVPKDSKKNRTICTEPALNMFYQLGAKECLEDILLKSFRVSLTDQPDINKSLAKRSSVDDTLSTLDLKNASDSISIALIRYLLPPETFNVLDTLRSHECQVGSDFVPLNMISTMGNGFTFPLMTLIFTALVKAVYESHDVKVVTRGKIEDINCGVFGDDIICLKEHSAEIIDLLQRVGFVINLDKSFVTGPFKESCGGDYYFGHDVRGVYIKELNNETDVYSAFNRLHRWSLRHNIMLCRALQYLLTGAKFRPVPRHCSDDSGFILTSDHLLSPKRDRNGALFYHALEPVPRGYKIRDSYRNPDGAFISALGGYVRGHFVTIRSNVAKYNVVKRKTPCWDFSYNPEILSRDMSRSWLLILDK